MAKKVVNFRFDPDDWELVQVYAKSQETTVTKLISSYLNSLIGKDTSKDSNFTNVSQDIVNTLSKNIEDCKDSIESFKTQFINNQNEILGKIQDRINRLEKDNKNLSKKVISLSEELTYKGRVIGGLNDEIDYIRDKIENIELSSLSLVKLKELAKQNEISFRSKIVKQDLIKLLIENEVVY